MKNIWTTQLIAVLYCLSAISSFYIYELVENFYLSCCIFIIPVIFCFIYTIKKCRDRSFSRSFTLFLTLFSYPIYYFLFTYLLSFLSPVDSEDYGAGLLGLAIFIITFILVLLNTLLGVLFIKYFKKV